MAENTPHVLFLQAQLIITEGKENELRMGYASSVDMISWNRRDEIAGISVSDSGWDSEMVSYPHVFMLDGETYMFIPR